VLYELFEDTFGRTLVRQATYGAGLGASAFIHSHTQLHVQEAQLSQRDRARFLSLNNLLNHSRSLKVIRMTLLSGARVSPY